MHSAWSHARFLLLLSSILYGVHVKRKDSRGWGAAVSRSKTDGQGEDVSDGVQGLYLLTLLCAFDSPMQQILQIISALKYTRELLQRGSQAEEQNLQQVLWAGRTPCLPSRGARGKGAGVW